MTVLSAPLKWSICSAKWTGNDRPAKTCHMIIIQSREPGQELESKILALLKREQIDAEQVSLSSRYKLAFPGLVIDGNAQQVFQNGEKAALTRNEFNLLLFLACNAGTVLLKEELFYAVWGQNSADTMKVVANTISNLRKKLRNTSDAQPYIRTVRGGYVFSAPG